MTDLAQAIEVLESASRGRDDGLPEDVFLMVSRMTPMVNVDLLIRDDSGRTLLTWRDDGVCQPGWHVPGGIVRFQETLGDRVRKTALAELGADVDFQPAPLAVYEMIASRRTTRGHFLSLLFGCKLLGPPAAELRHLTGQPAAGHWCWHVACPDDLIEVHEHYRAWIAEEPRGRRGWDTIRIDEKPAAAERCREGMDSHD